MTSGSPLYGIRAAVRSDTSQSFPLPSVHSWPCQQCTVPGHMGTAYAIGVEQRGQTSMGTMLIME